MTDVSTTHTQYDSPLQRIRRPGMTEFDSLQDLLEEAGYKDTRIFTPVSIKSRLSSAQESPIAIRSHSQSHQSIKEQSDAFPIKQVASSNWFSTLWRPAKEGRMSTLNRKQSEPVLSKKARKAVQKGWMTMWDNGKETRTDGPLASTSAAAAAAAPCITSTRKASIPSAASPPAPCTTDEVPAAEQSQPQRPPLRHAPSTSNLWQGSMKYHRSLSYPSKLREQYQNKTISRKESFDGAGVVAGVGVGTARTVSGELLFKARSKQRISLRQAFGQEEEEIRPAQSECKSDGTSTDEYKDSVGSLADLVGAEDGTSLQQQVSVQESKTKRERNVVTAMPLAATLFSTAATPLLSRQDAVALRNVGCLDFAGLSDDNFRAGRSSKGLRKMRSVDALELALAKMERQSIKSNIRIEATIPESFSTDSLTNEDLASGQTITTVVEDVQMYQDVMLVEHTIQRSSTPRLVITSPTGLRSPQPLVLEGLEFEPRSVSPNKAQVIRPVANRSMGWKVNAVVRKSDVQRERNKTMDEMIPPTNIPKRSTSKRRSRGVKSKVEDTTEENQGKLPMPSGRTAKRRLSKSCNDLRGSALSKMGTSEVPLAGLSKLSGSEQIRALQRTVLKRSTAEQSATGRVEASSSISIPYNSLEDDDDPFRDFAAVTRATTTSSSSASNRSSTTYQIDRSGMSPIPFDHSKRRPLSVSTRSNVANTQSQQKKEQSLQRKKSGVGIACLCEEVIKPCTSSSSLQSDENTAPNPLLDSPTAHVVKKRSSRTLLRQHG